MPQKAPIVRKMHEFLSICAPAVVLLVGCGAGNHETHVSPRTLAPAQRTAKSQPATASRTPTDTAANAGKQDRRRDIQAVQEDVRAITKAVFGDDLDTVVRYTHPKIIEMMGGRSQAKSALQTGLSQIQATGMTVESQTFPEDPTFLKSDVHEFVILPTKSVFAAKGQRAESLNYQLGIRPIGTAKWTYIEGSRVNRENVRQWFPDFPEDYQFPPFYRKRL